MAHQMMIPMVGGRVWESARGGGVDYRGDWRTATGGSDSDYYTQTANIKHLEYLVVSCVNAFRMDSSNLSFTTKYCTCASITFLAAITVLMDNTYWMMQQYTTKGLGMPYSYILRRLFECNIVRVMLKYKYVGCHVSLNSPLRSNVVNITRTS
jgi:hypothetical protein